MAKLIMVMIILIAAVDAWDNEELELFDLVEEVQKNFYEILGLDSSANQSDIRRAYRKLSLQLHPDKNKEDDAEEKFRQLVAVAEILKDETQRKRYDEILVHGLPDWRQPVFYYRRVRKMGLAELTGFLLVILTIGQYLVAWSMYLEKKLVLDEILSRKRKTKKKKKDSRQSSKHTDVDPDEYIDEQMNAIPKPEIKDLIPFQIYRLLVATIKATPGSLMRLKNYIVSLKERKQEEEQDDDEVEEEERKTKRSTKVYFEKVEYKVLENAEPVSYTAVRNTEENKTNGLERQILKGGEWSDDDVSLLAKSMAKYPGGTSARWEKIAEEVGRPVSEVSKKARVMKSSAYAISVQASSQGITGGVNAPVTSKSGRLIEEGEMTTRLEEIEANKNHNPVILLEDSEEDGAVRRRHRKGTKNVHRTTLISKTSEQIQKEQETSPEKEGWGQDQQKLFEQALAKIPKNTTERWEKIADDVPGKTKDECIARYKELVEMIRKKKQGQSS